MSIQIRTYTYRDAETLLNIHYRAVHETAARDYEQVILDNWSRPVDENRIADFRANPDKELRLVAEFNNQIAGFGALVIANKELRACYVDPDCAGHGVGRALVEALAREARQAGLDHLEFDSSLTAESFYNRLGFQTLRHDQHEMRNGVFMPCVRMYRAIK